MNGEHPGRGEFGVRLGLALTLASAAVLSAGCERTAPRPPASASMPPAYLPTISPPPLPSPLPNLQQLLRRFDADRAFGHLTYLADTIGPRLGGTQEERRAADYIANRLQEYGYAVRRQAGIPLTPAAGETQNVIAHAKLPARQPAGRLVVGAHYDTVAGDGGSPGANDNASGVAVMLEAARVLAETPLPIAVEWVAFGAEESVDGNPDHHHYGSRAYVAAYLKGEMAGPPITGMVSLDMIGVGDHLFARTTGKAPPTMRDQMLESAQRLGIRLTRRGSEDWSDHAPFEAVGISSVWLQRLWDADKHTAGDVSANVSQKHLETAGRLVLHLLCTLEAESPMPAHGHPGG